MRVAGTSGEAVLAVGDPRGKVHELVVSSHGRSLDCPSAGFQSIPLFEPLIRCTDFRLFLNNPAATVVANKILKLDSTLGDWAPNDQLRLGIGLESLNTTLRLHSVDDPERLDIAAAPRSGSVTPGITEGTFSVGEEGRAYSWRLIVPHVLGTATLYLAAEPYQL